MSSTTSRLSITSRLENVTPFPPIAARLLTLFSNPSVDLLEVVELIRSDAGLTARILQRVNSAEISLVYPVFNMQQAVTTLGIAITRQITVMHATAAYTRGALRTAELRRCWQHAVATAVLAEEIAQSCEAFTNVAFTAGIMHDIGRLSLMAVFPEEYERIIRDAASQCLDLLDFERETFGVHHAEAGRMLAERWGFPEELRVVAGRHHDPCEGAELDPLRIVHVACELAEVLGYDVTHPLVPRTVEEVLAQLPARARERMQATPEQLCARVERLILEHDSDDVDPTPELDLDEENGAEPAADANLEVSRGYTSDSSFITRVVFVAMAAAAAVAAVFSWSRV